MGERDATIDDLQAGTKEDHVKFVGAQQQIDDLKNKVGDGCANALPRDRVLRFIALSMVHI